MTKDEERKIKRFIKECGLYHKFVVNLNKHEYFLPSANKRGEVDYKTFIEKCDMINFINFAFVWDSKVWIDIDTQIKKALRRGIDLLEFTEHTK